MQLRSKRCKSAPTVCGPKYENQVPKMHLSPNDAQQNVPKMHSSPKAAKVGPKDANQAQKMQIRSKRCKLAHTVCGFKGSPENILPLSTPCLQPYQFDIYYRGDPRVCISCRNFNSRWSKSVFLGGSKDEKNSNIGRKTTFLKRQLHPHSTA